MKKVIAFLLCIFPIQLFAQALLSPFEKSGGKQTATYFECIDFYQQLDRTSAKISIKETGMSDAGYPYHVVLYANDGTSDPVQWHKQHKIVILIINGIHPGEPDGIDASMMLLRDLANGKTRISNQVALAVIPIYNIGGALNRNSFSRVNQDGPDSYGFRGNAQNLDLNRDFTKCDSRDAISFTTIFHWLDPDVQLDNHVSDGADYQHTMTLISTQWNKLGGSLGNLSHDIFDPALYGLMERSGWPMCPYVNFEEGDTEKGWEAFPDFPRYSSGYAALFHTLSFISETHMLKPFPERVRSTYALMQSLIETSSRLADHIIANRNKDKSEDQQRSDFTLSWKVDSSRADSILFRGYTASHKISAITGLSRLYYDHSKPFEKNVPYYNHFIPEKQMSVPVAYVIPQGWHVAIGLLALNRVEMHQLTHDSTMRVQVYHIESYKSFPNAYEKHHKNGDVKVSTSMQTIRFLKGDYIIPTKQSARRFLVEMLEPIGDDSYFAWNFFDAILQEKEGYSDYRWEDVAAAYLVEHPELKTMLDERKKSDAAFAKDASAQLEFVYKNSPYYEPEHMRYPVYRLLPTR